MRIFSKNQSSLNKKTSSKVGVVDGLELLSASDPFIVSLEERANMTIACKDSDYIPKVKDAGKFKRSSNTDVQIMHNGLMVKRGGYYGSWMERIIEELKGHHEQQEEKVFFEILKRLKP
mgnify:FL=1